MKKLVFGDSLEQHSMMDWNYMFVTRVSFFCDIVCQYHSV